MIIIKALYLMHQVGFNVKQSLPSHILIDKHYRKNSVTEINIDRDKSPALCKAFECY